jgi:alkylation response protein AidB-like acyl-CoA dehydrogenase
MDIAFSPEQEAYREGFARWLRQNLPADWGPPHYRGPEEHDANWKFQVEWERKLYAAGYGGIHWPKAYGGQGLTVAEHYIVNNELGLCAAPEGANGLGRELVGPIILAVGSEEQKKHYIPRILRCDDIWCQGFSEPGAGSDLAALQTKAVRDGDDWIIDGQKVWTSLAHFSNWCILLARTDPAATKHKGITLFLVPMDTPGITIRPLVQITGRREFNEVFFDGVRVPDHLRLGGVNDGWNVANGVLAFERGTTRMNRQGRYMHELGELIDHCRSGHDGAEPLANNPYYRQKLARAFIDFELVRYRNLKTVSRIVNGEPLGPEGSVHKLWWSEAHQRLADLAIEIHGADFDAGPAAERFRDTYLQSRAETIYAGTSQIQRNIIAERVLGLPR